MGDHKPLTALKWLSMGRQHPLPAVIADTAWDTRRPIQTRPARATVMPRQGRAAARPSRHSCMSFPYIAAGAGLSVSRLQTAAVCRPEGGRISREESPSPSPPVINTPVSRPMRRGPRPCRYTSPRCARGDGRRRDEKLGAGGTRASAAGEKVNTPGREWPTGPSH